MYGLSVLQISQEFLTFIQILLLQKVTRVGYMIGAYFTLHEISAQSISSEKQYLNSLTFDILLGEVAKKLLVAVIIWVLKMYCWPNISWYSGTSSCSDGYLMLRYIFVFTWSSARNHLGTITGWINLWLKATFSRLLISATWGESNDFYLLLLLLLTSIIKFLLIFLQNKLVTRSL